jgi:hypothetical protein
MRGRIGGRILVRADHHMLILLDRSFV